jgi:hypothetical protein
MPRTTSVKKDSKAKNNPAVIRKAIESSEQTAGQDTPRVMRSTGPARESLEPARIQRVGRVVSGEKLEMLKFNEDILTVMVHESTNQLDDPIPEVWNDGKCQRFQRGLEQEVKRKYVEVLARAKKTIYKQERVKDGNGDDTIVNRPQTALKYPFVVLRDPSPRGAAWLKSIMAEA